jgi:hypothetical protein
MVDLNNFAIIVKNNNARSIVNYISSFMSSGGLNGDASNGAWYYINDSVNDLHCTTVKETVKNIPIYTLEEFIELYENPVKNYELW